MEVSIWLCVTPERNQKTRRLMRALAQGIPRSRMVYGDPQDGTAPFCVWGQEWLTLRIVPHAVLKRRPFWHIDNGFVEPARGTAHGYYRLTYRSMSPVLLADPEPRPAFNVAMRPWRRGGRHVVLALPGVTFGRALGIDVPLWLALIQRRLHAATDRPIHVRPKTTTEPLDLTDAWALVTHSSNVAVDAVIAGIPVFVAPTSPAAPVGRTDLDIENPVMPDRTAWLASLMCQQFTLPEMANGTAWRLMRKISSQVDGV
jgi:hypothetical protein